MPRVILISKKVASCDLYGYFYVQSDNSIMRDEKKNLKKAYDKLSHYDDMVEYMKKLNISNLTKENIMIYYTNSLIMSLKDLKGNDYYKFLNDLKRRKMHTNIKIRNFKQLLKRILFYVKR